MNMANEDDIEDVEAELAEEEAEDVREEAEVDTEMAQAKAELEGLNETAEQVVNSETTGTELVSMRQSAEQARMQLAQQRASALKIRTQLAGAAKRMQSLQSRKAAVLERRMARELERMEAMLEPLRDQLEVLEEAVWTVNLYLGRNEQMVRLAKGKPAPAKTPVVVRQLVLAMDQECAMDPEADGIDSLNHEKFDDWLQEDWAHVEQVIPEEKAVVALVPRYDSDPKFYDDPSRMVEAIKGNEQLYFLIRNGKNLYRTWTEFELGSYRLIPAKDEFIGYFRQRKSSWEDGPDYKLLEPGSREWAKAEKAASYQERQYMRVALILEGLLHRTTVFHPLPDAGVGISFTDTRSHEAGRVQFVLDGERLLTTGEHQPFDEWLASLTGQLRKGMRIVGNFSGERWREADRNRNSEYSYRYGHSRVRPNGAEHPETAAIYRIEDQESNGNLIVRYQRTREVYARDRWGSGEYRAPKNRASAIIRPGDTFVIPLDLVTIDECERYLQSRLERHEYTTMFPVLKAVIRAKQAEAAVEAPFREMMVGVLMRETSESREKIEADLPALIDWYKLANRIHRPLFLDTKDNDATTAMLEAAGVDWNDIELALTDPGTGEPAYKGIKLMTDEYKRRLRDAKTEHSTEVIQGLRALHPDVLLIARARNGRYIALTPEDERPVYVHERQYTTKLELREDKSWILPGTRVTRWTVLFKSERWAEWDLTATRKDYLTGPEREAMVEHAKRHSEGDHAAVTAIWGKRHGDEVSVWTVHEPEEDETDYYDGDDTAEPGLLTERRSRYSPAWTEHQFKWRRKGEAVQYYKRGKSKEEWRRYRGERSEKPWSPDQHHDRVLIWEDPTGKQMARFHKLSRAYKARERQREEMKKLRDRAVESIRDQWLKPRYERAYAQFLQDYADPDLWDGHLKANKDTLPEWKHEGDNWSHGSGEPLPWLRALNAIIERGQEPWGMTVREVVELAQNDDRFNYVWRWDEKVAENEYGGKSSSDPELPREQWATPLAKSIADLTYVDGYKLEVPWPVEDEEDEEEQEPWCEECGEFLEDCTCEEDEQDENTVEGSVEEGVAALPKGSE